MEDIRIESFNEVDLSDIKLPIITIYKNPKDYPLAYVARIFDLDKPTNTILVDSNLEGLRSKVPGHMYKFPRDAEDDKNIIEVWI